MRAENIENGYGLRAHVYTGTSSLVAISRSEIFSQCEPLTYRRQLLCCSVPIAMKHWINITRPL